MGKLRALLAQLPRASSGDAALVADIAADARRVEAEISGEMRGLACELEGRVGRGRPLTFTGAPADENIRELIVDVDPGLRPDGRQPALLD